MSTERSSSAVRNLRSLFENQESVLSTPERPQPRPRSVSQEGAREGRRPLSKVRSSFVVVEQNKGMMEASEGIEDMPELTQVSSASRRRSSFSENAENHDQLQALKKIVSQESERRERDSSVQETIPEAALESTPISTPRMEPKEGQPLNGTKPSLSKLSSFTTANPDKPVTAVDEEEVGSMKPADPTDESAISAGEALGTCAEDISAKTTQPGINGSEPPMPASKRSSGISKPTQTLSEASKSASAGSRTTLVPKSAAKAPARDLNRKVSRSSLTAPTAASNARAAEKRESTALNSSASTKVRARESTKTLNVSSHLLAPTAASRAKHDQDTGKSLDGRSTKSDARGAPVKSSSTRSAQRSSLAHTSRPESRSSHTAVHKSAPLDGSFLDRMTRPTAASQNRAQDKYEVKSSPKKSLPLHKKATTSKSNGVAKPTTAEPEVSTPTTATGFEEDESSILDLSGATPAKQPASASEIPKEHLEPKAEE